MARAPATAPRSGPTFGDASSIILGEAQRLPNGNTLVVYTTDGIIAEISPSGVLVQSLSNGSDQYGYSSFRETLYGPPQE